MQKVQERHMAPPLRRRIFLTVSAGVFMSTMDSSLVNVALPVLMKVFHSSLAVTQWVVLIYLLTITILLIFCGRLADQWGAGAVYSRGMLLFALGSLLCGAAPTIWLLILFRFVQALGASMMMATGPALIRSIFPPERLGRGLGLVGIATSLGLMTGPVLSGLLLRWVHWRAVFLVTVPVGLLFYLAGRRQLVRAAPPLSAPTGTGQGERPGLFDLTGALMWAVTVSLTILLATHATTLCCGRGFVPSTLFWSGFVLTGLCWLVFLRRETRSRAPILPLQMFRRRFFAMAVLSSALSFAVLFFVLILTPFYLARILGLPPDRMGYVMMAVPLSVFVVSPAAGRLHDRIGARIVATAGLGCCLIAVLLLAALDVESSPLSVAMRLTLLGFGQAMFLSPNSASALAGVSDDQAGVTASLLATARNFGMLAGTALAGLSFALHFAWATGGLDMRDFVPAAAPEFMHALTRSFQYAAVVGLIGVAASWSRQGKAAEE
ncbi:MAG TPA: MFS transporter [Desulfobacteraceae bacterium]|nr:MFS transporter [Desulfobacteraceae bacterium]